MSRAYIDVPPGGKATSLVSQYGVSTHIIEGTRTMLYKFFLAVDRERAVDVDDVYNCVFERDVFREEQISGEQYHKMLKVVRYLEVFEDEQGCHGRPL